MVILKNYFCSAYLKDFHWGSAQLQICLSIKLCRLHMTNTTLLCIIASRGKKDKVCREFMTSRYSQDVADDDVSPSESNQLAITHNQNFAVIRTIIFPMAYIVLTDGHNTIKKYHKSERNEGSRNAIRYRDGGNALKNANL